MSLTIALTGAEGLVMAADSRITKGYSLAGPKTKDDSQKFLQLNDHCGAMTYGLSDIGNAGVAVLKEEISNKPEEYTSISVLLERGKEIFSAISQNWKQENPNIKRADKDVGFILAGYEIEHSEFRIYSLQSPDFLPRKIESGCLLAGQWHIAKFLMNRLYTKNLSLVRLKELAALLLHETMTAEQTVGGAINLAVITQSGGFQWISPDELASIIKKNNMFLEFFRQKFYSALIGAADQ